MFALRPPQDTSGQTCRTSDTTLVFDVCRTLVGGFGAHAIVVIEVVSPWWDDVGSYTLQCNIQQSHVTKERPLGMHMQGRAEWHLSFHTVHV